MMRCFCRTIFVFLLIVNAHSATAENATTEPAESDKPVATVQTAVIRTGEISKTMIAYGSVVAAPGAMNSISVSIESRVSRLDVSAGQSVKKGTALMELEPSPDTKLQFLDARNGLEAAKKNLADMQQRFDLKLSTNADLMQAQQAVQAAEVRFDDLKKRGAAEDVHKILAEGDGQISKIDVQEGQLIPAGGPVVELLSKGKVEVSLGVEPSEISLLSDKQSVQLFSSASGGEGVSGEIRLISGHLNPATRLVDVFITPNPKSALLMDDFVRGELKVAKQSAMIVPESAILMDDDGASIFIVKDSKAVKKPVKVVLQNDKDTAIAGEDVHDGDAVVVQGNLELEDGMAVSVEAGK